MKVQVTIAGETPIKEVRRGLEAIVKKYPNATFYSCFLPKNVLEEKGASTELVDTMDEILGVDSQVKLLEGASLENFRTLLPAARKEAADSTDILAIIGVSISNGVAEEITAVSKKPIEFY